MMFSRAEGHIEKVIQGRKTQTRRYYKHLPGEKGCPVKVGELYLVRENYRQKKEDCSGHIRVLRLWTETLEQIKNISVGDAWAEGEYTPEQYLEVLLKINHGRLPTDRPFTVIEFEFAPRRCDPTSARDHI